MEDDLYAIQLGSNSLVEKEKFQIFTDLRKREGMFVKFDKETKNIVSAYFDTEIQNAMIYPVSCGV